MAPRTFGTLFSYDSCKNRDFVISYYRVILLKDWMDVPVGTDFYRVDFDMENGDVYFFDFDGDEEYVCISNTF